MIASLLTVVWCSLNIRFYYNIQSVQVPCSTNPALQICPEEILVYEYEGVDWQDLLTVTQNRIKTLQEQSEIHVLLGVVL